MTFKFKPASPEELAQRKAKKAPLTPEPKKPAPRRRASAKPKE